MKYESGILVYSNEKYNCRVCYQKPELLEPHWKQHLESEKHYYAYKNYIKYFKDDNHDTMTCKLCPNHGKINWYQLEDHAITHKLAPWYFPPIRELRLYEDFLEQGEDYNYYCHLCKKNFIFWWQAHEHKTDFNHVELRRKMYPDSQLTKFNLSKPRILYYRQKRVFPLSDRMVWCWVCDEKILIPNIDEHCDEPRHLAAKRRAVELSKEKEKEKLPLEVVNESRDNCNDNLCRNDEVDDEYKTTGSQTKSKELIQTIKPSSKPPGHRYACSLCNVRLVQIEHIELHIKGLSHKDQVERLKTKYEKKKNLDFYDLPIGVKINDINKSSFKFKCTLCRLDILAFSDLILHIQSRSHLENTGKVYDIDSFSSNNGLPERILSTKLDDVFFCALCTCIIKGAKNITRHIQETHDQRRQTRHAESLSKEAPRIKYSIPNEHLEKARTTNEFPPEIKLIEIEEIYYWCSICECALYQSANVSSIDNSAKVWRHIGGMYHGQNKKLQSSSSSTTERNVTSKKIKLPEAQMNGNHVKNKEIDGVTSKVKPTQYQLPKENYDNVNNAKEFSEDILFIETEESSSLWCQICKCTLYSSENSAFNSKEIWQHIDGQNHRDNDAKRQKNPPESPTKSTPEIAADEELYCLPPEQLINVHVKDGKLSAVTCKPCDLYIHGELDDLGADWHRHLETEDHKQKAHIFSISKLSKLTI